jgi:hypothetical protein
MKLRLALIVLVLANVGYWLWARGDLAGFGLMPAGTTEREPQRLSRQVHPEWLQIRKDGKTGNGNTTAAP